MRRAELVADDRSAQRDRFRVVDLAQQLAAPVQVLRVRRVGLPVQSPGTQKDAVGADVHEPRARDREQPRQAMLQACVDRQRRQRIVCLSELLDQANAVDHRNGPRKRESARQRVEMLDVDPRDHLLP